jgi:hypothetical protein
MSREEAISIMNVIIHMLEPQYDTDRIEDAVEKAIKALEQEPCTDAISRKAVDKIINKWLSSPDYELKDGIYDMTKKIHKLPPVTPAEKVGHWIDRQEDRWIYAKCSECETIHDTRTNYCPHCGAKMQEVDG